MFVPLLLGLAGREAVGFHSRNSLEPPSVATFSTATGQRGAAPAGIPLPVASCILQGSVPQAGSLLPNF